MLAARCAEGEALATRFVSLRLPAALVPCFAFRDFTAAHLRAALGAASLLGSLYYHLPPGKDVGDEALAPLFGLVQHVGNTGWLPLARYGVVAQTVQGPASKQLAGVVCRIFLFVMFDGNSSAIVAEP